MIASGLYPLNNYQIPERGARLASRDPPPPRLRRGLAVVRAVEGPRTKAGDRAYREYVREEQRRQPGCPARKLVLDQGTQATIGLSASVGR